MAFDADAIAKDLTAFIRRRFQVSDDDKRFGRDIHLANEGYVDSLGVAEVVSFIEGHFDVRLPDDAFFDEDRMTINGMIAMISALLPASTVAEGAKRSERVIEVRSFAWTTAGRRKDDPEMDAVRPIQLDAAQLRRWLAEPPSAQYMGHFGVQVKEEDGKQLLSRDALGVNKLFYAVTPTGPVCSSFWHDLVEAGYPSSSIWSVPAGHTAVFEPGAQVPNLVRHTALPFDAPALANLSEEAMGAQIRKRLEAIFQGFGTELKGRRVYVSLSGGLDSTAVAALAREVFENVTAVTFKVGEHRSEDLVSAEKVAKDLGIRHHVIELAWKDVLSLVDEALIWGQDWREFNVHCALVNIGVARAIRKDSEAAGVKDRPVVLTGDCMNELMCDYTPVQYKGQEYYTLPKVPIGLLRRVLVGGLDAGDREVGVFWKCGVETVQPYALAASAYVSIPAALLERDMAKQKLVRSILGSRIPEHVYGRKKVRAQEGTADSGGGTLAVCVDNGLDGAFFRNRFAELFGVGKDELQQYIRGGYYRCKPATGTRSSIVPPPMNA